MSAQEALAFAAELDALNTDEQNQDTAHPLYRVAMLLGVYLDGTFVDSVQAMVSAAGDAWLEENEPDPCPHQTPYDCGCDYQDDSDADEARDDAAADWLYDARAIMSATE